MMHSHAIPRAISGVLYAEDFDEPLLPPLRTPSVVLIEPEVAAPSFSLDELRAATEQAHEAGMEYARHAAEKSAASQRIMALAALAEQLAATQKQAARMVEQALDGVTCTTLSLLAVALPALCASHAESELRALLHRVLPPMRQVPELQIRVHPDLREAIEDETRTMLEGSGTQVTWINSAKLAPGDIAIAWQNGGALRDTGATCIAIRDAVLALLDAGAASVVIPKDMIGAS
jgi:imidazolonepropionase-like amidohydrolase